MEHVSEAGDLSGAAKLIPIVQGEFDRLRSFLKSLPALKVVDF